MIELAHWVGREFGGVDFLASNLRPFRVGSQRRSPDYITGLGHYWWCLSPDQMMRFDSFVGELLTLGPRGVADASDAAKARNVLPYAHWWREPGQHDELEDQLCDELELHVGDSARVLRWDIGDAISAREPAGARVRVW